MNVPAPSRAQLEIGLVVIGTLALIALYRSYLERSLALQDQHYADLYADLLSRVPEPPAANGRAPAATASVAARRADWLHTHAGEPLPTDLRPEPGGPADV